FNGDGSTDILWRDNSTGAVSIWLMNGTQVQQASGLGVVPTNWSIASTGDFNGDGFSDILWIDNTGNVSVWFMNGTSVSSAIGLGTVGRTWSVQAQNSE